MYQDDIEKVLQRYGDDRRQQQQVAARVRHLAHVQARRRTIVASTLLLLTATVWVTRQIPTSQAHMQHIVAELQLGEQISGQSDEKAFDAMENAEMANTNTTKTGDQKTISSHNNVILLPHNLIAEESSVLEESRIDVLSQHDSTVQKKLSSDTIPVTIPETPPESLAELPSETIIIDHNPVEPLVPHGHKSRFKLTSSITASATSHDGIGYSLEIDGLVENVPYSTISPSYSFSANIGTTYTFFDSGRKRFDIGLTFSCYSHQGKVLNVDYSDNYNGIYEPSGYSSSMQIIKVDKTYNTFSLYVGIPLTINKTPKDSKSIGWCLSLTPAHSIVMSRMPGTIAVHRFSPNPWRLDIGAGILFHNKFPSRISLIANLLPIYSSLAVHEIGIEIGF